MSVNNRRGPPIHISPVCDIQNIALNVVLSTLHIIFVDTGVLLSRRQANGVYATIGVHLVKGWVLLEAIENSALYAQVGDFLQKLHEQAGQGVGGDVKVRQYPHSNFFLLNALPE